ncbi:hypothetical protein SedNR2807_34380 [Citrobacter sedlakii]|uniref:hypothetical protein n=1 Tax=Citrobacter TaxID=544 RepID=UPI0015E8F7DE|nr:MULTISPECIES: hypothetical protein [Citrobacter]EHG7582005.1 hypothetical protein [Citrobacter sedlakii]EIQ7159129.1 hypothetical protein [Citrobacter sedlakii]MBN6600713.1 hypothetical protein [Citrobacter sedlakii]QMK47206.1 hypothetical protein HVX72_16710 [Citrobacter sp. RHB21-C05]QMK65650.1 hypothetical protein HVX68_16710 [Citrobacter sp. RHB21-C01]
MNEDELIKIMYENNFSKKQVNKLKKLSQKYSTSLYETVSELARRFFRSLFMHILTFILVFHSYIRLSEEHGHTLQNILFSIGVLCLAYVIIDLFAPLSQGYKARKVIQQAQRKENSK